MVTIKEIAKVCNLSPTAVSKALRNDTGISQQTMEKVKKVADELGYLPNIAAIRLKTKHSFMLGILLKDGKDSGVEHEFFAAIINAFMKETRNKGYSVIFISDRIGKNVLTYSEFAKAYGCDAVLVLTGDIEDASVLEMIRSNIPVVTVDHLFSGCSTIISDNELGIGEMVKYAYNMGHRKIAMIHGEDTPVSRIRVASFYKICESLGIDVPDDYIRSGMFHDTESAERETYSLLDLKEPPTFIFYQDDFAFLGGRNALENRGLSYPEDISVAGYDGLLLSQVIKPSLMSWKQNTYEMGKQAAHLLIETIENKKTYIPRIVPVKGCLLKGSSVKNLNNNS